MRIAPKILRKKALEKVRESGDWLCFGRKVRGKMAKAQEKAGAEGTSLVKSGILTYNLYICSGPAPGPRLPFNQGKRSLFCRAI